MRRVTSVLLLAPFLLPIALLAPSPAAAGDYSYDGGYYRSGYNNGSSSCCYRRVVRYERVNNDGDYAPRRSYYDRPYRYTSSYYDSPRRYDGDSYGYRSSSYETPRRYYGDNYTNSYASSCYRQRVKVYDQWGGWVWGQSQNCY